MSHLVTFLRFQDNGCSGIDRKQSVSVHCSYEECISWILKHFTTYLEEYDTHIADENDLNSVAERLKECGEVIIERDKRANPGYDYYSIRPINFGEEYDVIDEHADFFNSYANYRREWNCKDKIIVKICHY